MQLKIADSQNCTCEKETKCCRCELSEVGKLNLRRNTMKITAGLGSIDEYVRYVEAGADEFFCGYVPYEWNKNTGRCCR